jgi:hypothetical protein
MLMEPTPTNEAEMPPYLDLITFELRGTDEIPLEQIKVTWVGEFNGYGRVNDPRHNAVTGKEEDYWRDATPEEMKKWEYSLVDGVFLPPEAAAGTPVGSRYKLLIEIPPLELVSTDQRDLRLSLPLNQIYSHIKEKYGAQTWEQVSNTHADYYVNPINNAFRSFLEFQGIDVNSDVWDLEPLLENFKVADFDEYVSQLVARLGPDHVITDEEFCHSQCYTAAYTIYPNLDSRIDRINKILERAGIKVDTDSPKVIEENGKVMDSAKYWCIFTAHEKVYQRHYGHHNVRTS